jgi:hypothetical protein
MPDEHDAEAGPEGPHRPALRRGPVLRAEHPGPDGNVIKDHYAAAGARADQAHAPSPPDPRFKDAPLSTAEQKALHQAPDAERFNQLLGSMQEARMADGRLAPAPTGPEATIAHMRVAEQIALGLRPTAEQLAHINAAPTAEVRRDREDAFLVERAAQNRDLFRRSRHWDHTLAPQPIADAERGQGQHGIQAWRAEVAQVQKFAYRLAADEGRAASEASRDARFDASPLTQIEIDGLKQAPSFQAAAERLTHYQAAREQDGRLAPSTDAQARQALIHRAFSPQELARLGLRPTAPELAFMQTNAHKGEELERTLLFIQQRHAQNAQWRRDPENAAQVQAQLRARNSSFWYQKELGAYRTGRDGDRAAARERPNAGELSALRRQVREQNEQAARNAENEGRTAGRGHGGRSR